jgi:ribosomal protein S18 acetylase RimI-like enzyme
MRADRSEGSDPEIRVRAATEADQAFAMLLIPRLVEMDLPPWRDPDAIRASSERGVTDAIRGVGGGGMVLVAEDANGDPMGLVHLEPEKDFFTGEERGYVANLAVAARAEGRGVGRALMAAAEAWCRDKGYGSLTLYVFAANHGARRFYHRLGFEEDSLKLVKHIRSV